MGPEEEIGKERERWLVSPRGWEGNCEGLKHVRSRSLSSEFWVPQLLLVGRALPEWQRPLRV